MWFSYYSLTELHPLYSIRFCSTLVLQDGNAAKKSTFNRNLAKIIYFVSRASEKTRELNNITRELVLSPKHSEYPYSDDTKTER